MKKLKYTFLNLPHQEEIDTYLLTLQKLQQHQCKAESEKSEILNQVGPMDIINNIKCTVKSEILILNGKSVSSETRSVQLKKKLTVVKEPS
jgi:hypothetical protein